MKTTIQIAAILLFGILLTATACNKDKMPEENKDWNVLEWTVDGERYKADCEGDPLFGCDPVDCQYYHENGAIEIVGGTLEPTKGFYISIHEGIKLVEEDFKLKESDQVKYANKELVQECRMYLPDTNKISHPSKINKKDMVGFP